MYIRSQNRLVLTTCDNIIIEQNKSNKDCNTLEIVKYVDNGLNLFLGKYDSLNRCREVLDEIQKTLLNWLPNHPDYFCNVFDMPKE